MSNVHQRFHVCCECCGFVAGVANSERAFRVGDNHEHGYVVSVFDSLARRGAWQEWEQEQGGWAPVSRKAV